MVKGTSRQGGSQDVNQRGSQTCLVANLLQEPRVDGSQHFPVGLSLLSNDKLSLEMKIQKR